MLNVRETLSVIDSLTPLLMLRQDITISQAFVCMMMLSRDSRKITPVLLVELRSVTLA